MEDGRRSRKNNAKLKTLNGHYQRFGLVARRTGARRQIERDDAAFGVVNIRTAASDAGRNEVS
jgi:hypothetical protein